MVDYSPLWKTMCRKGISQSKLIEMGIDPNVLHYMKMNLQLFPETIEKLKEILDCEEYDIVWVTADAPVQPYLPEETHDVLLTTIISSVFVLLIQRIISHFRKKRNF